MSGEGTWQEDKKPMPWLNYLSHLDLYYLFRTMRRLYPSNQNFYTDVYIVEEKKRKEKGHRKGSCRWPFLKVLWGEVQYHRSALFEVGGLFLWVICVCVCVCERKRGVCMRVLGSVLFPFSPVKPLKNSCMLIWKSLFREFINSSSKSLLFYEFLVEEDILVFVQSNVNLELPKIFCKKLAFLISEIS